MFSFPMAFNAWISFETGPERLPSSAGNSKNKKNIIKKDIYRRRHRVSWAKIDSVLRVITGNYG